MAARLAEGALTPCRCAHMIYSSSVRPAQPRSNGRNIDQQSREFAQINTPSDTSRDLKVLSDLHDRGKLNHDEFAQEKALK